MKNALSTAPLAWLASTVLILAPHLCGAAPDVDYTPIPSTVTGIWALIDTKDSELGNIVRSRQMDYVHHHAFSIRDLVDALLERARDCKTTPLQRLKEESASVAKLAAGLDRASDADDASALDSSYASLQVVLKAVRVDFPADCSRGAM